MNGWKLCPCGCGKRLMHYNSRRPLVCYDTWNEVPPHDRKAIMLPAGDRGAARAAVRRVLRIARDIRARRGGEAA
jgi:hypothetical protein